MKSEGEAAVERTRPGQPQASEGGPIATRRADELLGPRGVLYIEHRGEIYVLRITRNDRLILTK